MDAIDNGWEVLHPRTMSKSEREHLRERGGLESAGVLFGQKPVGTRIVDISNDPLKLAFVEWVRELGSYVGVEVHPQLIHSPQATMIADCTRRSDSPRMRFNLARLEDDFFVGRGEKQLALVIHELGHALASGQFSHGYSWGEGCARAGAMIALATNPGS